MKLIVWNVVRDAALDFDTVRQAIDDPQGAGMRPEHLGVVLTPTGADVELLARALEEIAADLREHGLDVLYSGAEIPAAA